MTTTEMIIRNKKTSTDPRVINSKMDGGKSMEIFKKNAKDFSIKLNESKNNLIKIE